MDTIYRLFISQKIKMAVTETLRKGVFMLYWSVVFFLVAVIAALFGFGGIAAASASIAKVLFFVFAIAFVISIVLQLAKKADNKL